MNRASTDFHQSHTVDEEGKAKLKYQTLANEFLELQKEFVSKKRKLKAAKRKRDKVFAEVRCLRQRRKILHRIKDSNKGKDILHLQNLDEEINVVEGERNHSASEVAAGNSDAIPKSEEDGRQHQVLEKEPGFGNGPKSGLIRDKVVGKRKISQHDQYTLQA
ncbi:uncharacterized protein LOC111379262 isoform X2 [Olea europaea var. sylvestris]|uniref:uncharacterized protein LOC111379262 isoform X2 n=1 Tax=Olea europaea var. sylvestris TaxID=158386 RepID=UPI000C1D7C46|nr:uncharacterized protein LOC111379262 isoform X2 [Olea europaea var. sylvestris]